MHELPLAADLLVNSAIALLLAKIALLLRLFDTIWKSWVILQKLSIHVIFTGFKDPKVSLDRNGCMLCFSKYTSDTESSPNALQLNRS